MRQTIAVLCLWILVFRAAVAATDATLVNTSDVWHYLKVNASTPAAEPARGWTSLEFEETPWRTAYTGFNLEHRHPALADIAGTPPRSRVFMRRRFQVHSLAELRTLRLKVEHEHGFKAYLNGVMVSEVKGEGMHLVPGDDPSMPGDEDVILTLADLDLTPWIGVLKSGENVLALEGEQTWPTAAPLTLSALLTANLSRGPFLQNTTTNGVTIVWRTDVAADSAVEFGKTPMLGQVVRDPTLSQEHAVVLTGLDPDTQYFYRVVSRTNDLVVTSELDYFRTFKERGSVSFVYLGDTGQNTPAQTAIGQVMASLLPDLVVHGGDVIYGGFDDKTPDTRVFAQYLRATGQMGNTPFFFAVGNHDLNCCGVVGNEQFSLTNFNLNAVSFQKTFYLPTNSVTGTEHFYSFDHGDVHFVSLFNPWFAAYDFNPQTVQYAWLTNDLAQTTKPWKMLFFHAPMAHSGQHALRDFNNNKILDQVEVMKTVGGVAQQYGVQLVLCSHEHNYERFAPTNGFHTVVSGGGGAALYQFTSRHPLSEQFYSANHCLKIDVAGATATIQAVGTNGVVLDRWVIARDLPLESLYHSAWNSPVVESGPADDKDGNLNGQSFDFVGKPILGRHGRFSNLGWFYANNDSTNLYLGFSALMIPDDANLFLFLESPWRAGVGSMKGVGNGVIDPTGEGADGLDCLENLSFSGFEPSVGILLGDEFGDGATNSFLRPKLGLNIGQGAYYLGQQLTPVPGVRIQQYNRSPQTNAVDIKLNGVAQEQNADFIEVAIPLASLGDLVPGETVRLAAVVGNGGFDPVAMTRELDSALLGSGMTLGDGNEVTIAPIEIQLALPVDLDTDGDGLPDEWELAFGLKANDPAGANGASGDPDGDGSTNIEEFLAGTDPTDPRSCLKLTLRVVGAQRVRLEWPMLPGRTYTIQYADNQLQQFTDLLNTRTDLPSPLAPRAVVDDFRNSPDTRQRSYRIRLEP